MSTFPKEIVGYDWEQVFQYCGSAESEDRWQHGEANVSPVIDSGTSAKPFQRQDVKRVIALSEGENDGPNWLCVVELDDGRFAFVSAGCDYTGWDCMASGYAMVDNDLQHLIRFGLGDSDRERLGLVSEAP